MDWGHSSSHLDRLLLFHACQFIMATAYQMHGRDYNKNATLRATFNLIIIIIKILIGSSRHTQHPGLIIINYIYYFVLHNKIIIIMKYKI